MSELERLRTELKDLQGRHENFKANEARMREHYLKELAAVKLAMKDFLDLWVLVEPKINAFIQLQAVRSGNYNIYDGPNLGPALEKMKSLL